MNSCSHRKWRENSCIRYRGENHPHECHPLNKTNMQNDGILWQTRFSHLSQVLREGWVGGVDLSLCSSVLNPCCKVGRKLGKGKASRCFIMVRTAVSFSGWLKHPHSRVTTTWAMWGWAGPRGVCALCTPGLCEQGLHNPGQTLSPSEEQDEAAVVRAVWTAVSWRQARPLFLIPCCPQTQSDSQPGTAGPLTSGFFPGEDVMGWVWQHQTTSACPAAPSLPLPLPRKGLAGFFANVSFLKMTWPFILSISRHHCETEGWEGSCGHSVWLPAAVVSHRDLKWAQWHLLQSSHTRSHESPCKILKQTWRPQ